MKNILVTMLLIGSIVAPVSASANVFSIIREINHFFGVDKKSHKDNKFSKGVIHGYYELSGDHKEKPKKKVHWQFKS